MRSKKTTEETQNFLEIQQALIHARAAERRLKLYCDTLKPQAEAALKSATVADQHDRTDFLTQSIART